MTPDPHSTAFRRWCAARAGELRRVAEAATPGPWDWRHNDELCTLRSGKDVVHGDSVLYASNPEAYGPNAELVIEAADRAYIAAANPAAVLALLDERDEWIAKFEQQFAGNEEVRELLRTALDERDGARQVLDNMLASVKSHFSEAEWEAARAEVFSNGNSGWTMVHGTVVQNLRAQLEQANIETVLEEHMHALTGKQLDAATAARDEARAELEAVRELLREARHELLYGRVVASGQTGWVSLTERIAAALPTALDDGAVGGRRRVSGDDVRHEDYACPLCGEWQVMYQECYGIGCDEGRIDGYDEDPMWFDEGDTYTCGTCLGAGFFRWCSACGADLQGMTFTEESEPQ